MLDIFVHTMRIVDACSMFSNLKKKNNKKICYHGNTSNYQSRHRFFHWLCLFLFFRFSFLNSAFHIFRYIGHLQFRHLHHFNVTIGIVLIIFMYRVSCLCTHILYSTCMKQLMRCTDIH